MLKQGINIVLPVNFSGIDMSSISRIEFVFKQSKSSSASALKTSEYKSDGTGDATLRNGTSIIDVPWTASETYLFAPESPVYMDTRITINDSIHNPITPIVTFPMIMSLFEEAEYGD